MNTHENRCFFKDVMLEHIVRDAEVAGSNPVTPTITTVK
jgi:hypothetical protein